MNKITTLLIIALATILFGCNQNQVSKNVTTDTLSNKESDIWYVFQNRRSVRKFKPDSIPEKDILKIIDAARMSPTSGNQQPWKFLVVKDRNRINQIKQECIKEYIDAFVKQKDNSQTKQQFTESITKEMDDYCSAAAIIVILTDNNSRYPTYNHWDGPLAAGYLMLAARALGYGTVFTTDAFSVKVIKDVLKIPDNYTQVCVMPIGKPYEWPITPPKKKLEDFIARETF